mmetsp:Transcript_16669/g.15034  ORF Transcript_16669/g.15034 Transcript_16669/m.15034 type:complete len:307 (+) Transcript_16669:16-936(+)
MKIVSILFILLQIALSFSADVPCEWRAETGDNFDLRPMMREDPDSSYTIIDGDIPCTPQIEPSFYYAWNFCGEVTAPTYPKPCQLEQKTGVLIQSLYLSPTVYFCKIIGRYDPTTDDSLFHLIDDNDPSKGVSMHYGLGDRCNNDTEALRSTQVDVLCKNVESHIVSAQEPELCKYHIVMESYYGCPSGCPVTESGLCNSHGHCSFDEDKKTSHCFCNEGYSGSDCSIIESKETSISPIYTKITTTTSTSSAASIELLIALFVVSLIILILVSVVLHKVSNRGQRSVVTYDGLPGTELVETGKFLP